MAIIWTWYVWFENIRWTCIGFTLVSWITSWVHTSGFAISRQHSLNKPISFPDVASRGYEICEDLCLGQGRTEVSLLEPFFCIKWTMLPFRILYHRLNITYLQSLPWFCRTLSCTIRPLLSIHARASAWSSPILTKTETAWLPYGSGEFSQGRQCEKLSWRKKFFWAAPNKTDCTMQIFNF